MGRTEEIKVMAEVGSPILVSLFVHMPSMHHEVASSSSLPTAADFEKGWRFQRRMGEREEGEGGEGGMGQSGVVNQPLKTQQTATAISYSGVASVDV